jgi:DNA-binding LacI/PurR family transcriptional regulator
MELEAKGMISRIRGKGSFVKKIERETKIKKSILFIYPLTSVSNTGLGEYTKGILEQLEGSEYQLLIQNENYLFETSMEKLLAEYIGIIYYPKQVVEHLDILYQLHLNKLPIVIIDKFFNGLPFKFVTANNLLGGEMATAHLIESGHKRIAFGSLANRMNTSSVRDRYLGYLKTLHEYSITETFHFTESDNQSMTEFFDYVTGIVMENDVLAIQLINRLNQKLISIPQNIAVVGFDNIQAAALIQPSLTTIEQNFYEIGKVACRLILEDTKLAEQEETLVTTDVKLIVRESSL